MIITVKEKLKVLYFVGEGSCGEVLIDVNGRCLKLIMGGQTKAEVLQEYAVAKKAGELGLGPRVYELYHYKPEKCYMFEMEYLQDFIMLSELSEVDLKLVYPLIEDRVEKLNEACIRHGDLHDDNIMINPKNGDIKFVDFGCASLHKKPVENDLSWFSSIA